MTRKLSLLIALLALGILAAGCGGSENGSASDSSSEPAASSTTSGSDGVLVEMKNIQFEPKTVTVKPGQTVRWENLDTVDHDAVATSGGDFKSDQFGRGGSYEYTPQQAGTIQYECTLHPGMVGTIEVR